MSPAFEATFFGGEIASVQYVGNDEELQVQIGEGATATLNLPGSDVFQEDIDAFQVLIDIRDDLRAGDLVSLNTRIGELEQVMTQTSRARAVYGANLNRLIFNQDRLEYDQVTLQDVLSQTEEADFAETVININMKEMALQAALEVGARIIQPSLLDFL